LHVAFIAYEYPPYLFGGVGAFSTELVKALSHSNIKLTVIAGHKQRAISTEKSCPNCEIIRFPILDLPPRHLWWQIGNYNIVSKLLSKIRPDIIHLNNAVASLLLKKIKKELNVPVLVTMHGDHAQILKIALKHVTLMEPYDFLTYIYFAPLQEKLLQIDFENVDYVVAVSNHVKRDIASRFNLGNIGMIYNGIDTNSLKLHRQEGDVNKVGKKRVIKITFAGRLYWVKGIMYALKAFTYLIKHHNISGAELHIYGDGPLRNKIVKYALKFRSIKYHGALPRDLFLKELSCSDIVILPSLYEACPMILFEANALHKPVLVSKMPWSAEFVEHGISGLKTDVCNIKDFAEALLELIENETLRKILSDNAFKGLKKYDISNTASLYLDLYRNLTN
jgi:glycosyltransferase involved in cell wall biosynthesis